MVLTAHVKNGAIVLDRPEALPEGAKLVIEVRDLPAHTAAPPSCKKSICEIFSEITKTIPDDVLRNLPTDSAERHDEYLHKAVERRE